MSRLYVLYFILFFFFLFLTVFFLGNMFSVNKHYGGEDVEGDVLKLEEVAVNVRITWVMANCSHGCSRQQAH